MGDNIIEIIAALGSAYPNFTATPQMIAIYERCLADIEPEILNAAVVKIITENKFFPTVAELREAAFAIMTKQYLIPSEYEAWEEVQKEIARCGDYYRYPAENRRDPAWSHPLIEKTVEAIGYKTLLMSDNIVADRAHFFQAYRTMKQRAESDVKMLPEVRQASENYKPEYPGALSDGIRLLTDRFARP